MPHPLDTCELCNIPPIPQGFTALANYVYGGVKGMGAGTSLISQEDANQKAQENAVRAALNNQGFYGSSLL